MSHARQERLAAILLGGAWLLSIVGFARSEEAFAPLTSSNPAAHAVIPIWPGKAPGSEGWTQKEIEYTAPFSGHKSMAMVRNVVTPTLTVYRPNRDKANGTAMIVCPGGGFRILSWSNEGTDVAEWLAAHGVTAFVLKYRLVPMPENEKDFEEAWGLWGKGNDERNKKQSAQTLEEFLGQSDEGLKDLLLAVADGRQAIRIVRQRSAEWKIDPNRIGIMGFSAGAFLTMGVVLDHDAQSRPDFAAPIYGGQVGRRAIPADAPPLFILVAQDDPLAPIVDKLHEDWHRAGHSAELHIYAKGGHGFGMMKQGLPVDHWIDRLGEWLDWQHLLTPRKATATKSH